MLHLAQRIPITSVSYRGALRARSCRRCNTLFQSFVMWNLGIPYNPIRRSIRELFKSRFATPYPRIPNETLIHYFLKVISYTHTISPSSPKKASDKPKYLLSYNTPPFTTYNSISTPKLMYQICRGPYNSPLSPVSLCLMFILRSYFCLGLSKGRRRPKLDFGDMC